MRTIYLDYNATTPLDPAVREAMLPFLHEHYGNPSSIHHVGRCSRAALDDARERIAAVLCCRPSELVFTSGGTESNNLAILGTARLLKSRGRHIITSSVEHHAVLNACEYLAENEGFTLTVLPVDRLGFVSPDALVAAIRPETTLVSIMAANNEIGTLQPIAELGRICRERGIVFHTDAVQWFGKQPFGRIEDFNADLVSGCGHKFHGPKGAGFLYIRSPLKPHPLLLGGSHENERRAGTENVAAIIGLAKAVELFIREPVFAAKDLLPLRDRLDALTLSLGTLGVTPRSPTKRRLINTVAFTVRGCDSTSILAGLDLEGICASSGSACSAGSLTPSHVMLALGCDRTEASSLIRFSLGRESTATDVAEVERVLPEVIQRAQAT
ncbi:MAG TPA: cysteine desulfurase family protein [Methylomirabilota bacterium]|nr:cysteine desulfurase family protein [Methylomirabilota bacterium]